MPKITGLMVYPLTQDWKFTIDERGATGLRKYEEKFQSFGGVEGGEELPSIGDSWSDDYFDCKVKRIDVTYLKDVDLCPRIFNVYYETEWIDTQADINDGYTTTPNELIISHDISAEFISVEPPADTPSVGFFWNEDDLKVTQPILFTVTTRTIVMQLMVTDMDAFNNAAKIRIGKVNMDDFIDCYRETLLFTGFRANPWRSETNEAKWRCELTFVQRLCTGNTPGSLPDGTSNDGWNFIIREKRANTNQSWWQKPYRMIPDQPGGTPKKKYLYDTIQMVQLLSAGIEEPYVFTVNYVPLK